MIDYFGLEADLSEEEQMIQESAHEFVEENVRLDIGGHWIEGTFSKYIFPS